ncbi:MAG: hypothetical protein KAH44_11775, partial [Oricola sp.]|nr:hypothetical protein [Oricola sp.]
MRQVLLFVLMIFAATPAVAQRIAGFAENADAEGALVVAMRDAAPPEALTGLLDDTAQANLARALTRAGFTGEAGATASFVSGAEAYGEIHLVGIGAGELRRRDWEDFGARAAGLAKASKAQTVSVIAPGASRENLADAAMGATIGQYSFDKYKSEPETVTGDLVFVTADAGAAAALYNNGRKHLADAVVWVRNMQS